MEDQFGCGSVPVTVAASIYGKDANWIRAGIIAFRLVKQLETEN